MSKKIYVNDVIDAMGAIDESLLDEVNALRMKEHVRKSAPVKRRTITLVGSIAASVCIIVAAGGIYWGGGYAPIKNSNDAASSASIESMYENSVVTDSIAEESVYEEVKGDACEDAEEPHAQVPQELPATMHATILSVNEEGMYARIDALDVMVEESQMTIGDDIYIPIQTDWKMTYVTGDVIEVAYRLENCVVNNAFESDSNTEVLRVKWSILPEEEPKIVE